mgnify:CR=1 FL=1
MKKILSIALGLILGSTALVDKASAQNPYLPLWEFIPDGEPYVFEDPDNPGKFRVYVYGSHDNLIQYYCGRDQVVWSAPVENLKDWRYDGVIFVSKKDAQGKWLAPIGKNPKKAKDGTGDVLYAPDVAVVTGKDGKKTYYLYPNVQSDQRHSLVAKSDRPDGPFEVCNWSPSNPQETVGPLAFDPAVFVDTDGKEFGYLWNKGFQKRNMKEIENTDFFLVPSRFSEKSLLNQGVSSMSIIRIPYGVDCSSFNYVPRENKKDDVINLVYTGVISYEKGVNYLLQAVSEMPSDHFTIDLMGVYSKDSTIYKTFSKYDNIHFRGYVSHKELALIYEKADAFFMASLGEGFTLSGLEAMACGLPVVCSENSGINDVIKDYKNGMVFEICNVPTIKEKMQWLYDNRSVLPLLSKNAHETSLNFTWESYYSKVNEAFNTILAK